MKYVTKLIIVTIAIISLILISVIYLKFKNNSNGDSFRFDSRSEFYYNYEGKMSASIIYFSSENANGSLFIYTTDSNGDKKEKEFVISKSNPDFKYINEVYQTSSKIRYVPSAKISDEGIIKLKIKHR